MLRASGRFKPGHRFLLGVDAEDMRGRPGQHPLATGTERAVPSQSNVCLLFCGPCKLGRFDAFLTEVR